MRFKVGQTVWVKTRRFGDHQYGDVGVVEAITNADEDQSLPVWVRFSRTQPDGKPPHSSANTYTHSDLELVKPLSKLEQDLHNYIEGERQQLGF